MDNLRSILIYTDKEILELITKNPVSMDSTKLFKVGKYWVKLFKTENLEDREELVFLSIFRTKKDAIKDWPEVKEYLAVRELDSKEIWRLRE